MFQRAKEIRDEHYKEASTWNEFMDALNAKNIVLTPWCNI
jgi:isopentenyldiphosphate isomerase